MAFLYFTASKGREPQRPSPRLSASAVSLVFGCRHKAALYYSLRKMAGRKETKEIFM
jgi:hypothetical protein